MNKPLFRLAAILAVASSLSNCTGGPPTANIIHGTPSGGTMPIYVMATYRDLKVGGLSAGWLRGWTQAEFEFLRLYPDRKICVRETQTPACRAEMPIALVAVPKSYLTGEIPGSLSLYHIMSGTGDLVGGAGSLLTGMAWFRGVKIGISGGPLASSSANATGGSATGGSSVSNSSSNSHSSSNSKSNSSSSSLSNSSSLSKVNNTFNGGQNGAACNYGSGSKGGSGYGGGGSGSGSGGSGSGSGGSGSGKPF